MQHNPEQDASGAHTPAEELKNVKEEANEHKQT